MAGARERRPAAAIGAQHGHRPVLVADEPHDRVGGVVGRDADELDVLALQTGVLRKPCDRGHLPHARAAPGGPDVQEHRLALEPRKLHRLLAEILELPVVVRRQVDSRALQRPAVPRREESQVDDPETQEYQGDDEPASVRSWLGVGHGRLSWFGSPVMIEAPVSRRPASRPPGRAGSRPGRSHRSG